MEVTRFFIRLVEHLLCPEPPLQSTVSLVIMYKRVSFSQSVQFERTYIQVYLCSTFPIVHSKSEKLTQKQKAGHSEMYVGDRE